MLTAASVMQTDRHATADKAACKHMGVPRAVHAQHHNNDVGVPVVQDNLVDEVADLDTVPNVKQAHTITAGISNSFGFGGHNSVVVFAPFKEAV